jgi:hypothetical protein
VDFAVGDPPGPGLDPFLVEDVEDGDLRVVDGVRVVVDVRSLDVGLALLEVELLDEVLLALDDINGLGVEGRQGGREVDLGDDLGLARDVDDDEVVGADAAEADGVGRVGLGRVEPLVLGVVEELVLLEEVEDLADLGPAEPLAVLERQLEGGALDVADEDGQVVG